MTRGLRHTRRGVTGTGNTQTYENRPMSKPIIVFDLDGTLVNTAPNLLDSLNHMLVSGGLAVVDDTAQ